MCESSLTDISIGKSWRGGWGREEEECMSTDMEAAETIRQLNLQSPEAVELL